MAQITAADLYAQADWSRDTFGPGTRLKGVLDHLRKELVEVEAEPTDPSEWSDLLILVFDGATRQGIAPAELIDAYHEKMRVNRARTWPDWRTASEDEAIEHDRTADVVDGGGEGRLTKQRLDLIKSLGISTEDAAANWATNRDHLIPAPRGQVSGLDEAILERGSAVRTHLMGPSTNVPTGDLL